MSVPDHPKIYHICHIDRLRSIIAEGGLLCDAEIAGRPATGTIIGMNSIKQRRLNLTLSSHPDIHVGECVPFYFCPRSIMLYLIFRANHDALTYRGGQGPIIHLEADLRRTVAWAEDHHQRWAFTLSNAGSSYFEDRCDLSRLHEIDWDAVAAHDWQQCKGGRQAEFLLERSFPWTLVSRIGVLSREVYQQAVAAMAIAEHKPRVDIERQWYYLKTQEEGCHDRI